MPLVIIVERFLRSLALRLTRMIWLFETPLMRSSELHTMRLCPWLIPNMGGLFFVDGPDRTGKTYMYKAHLAVIHVQKKIVVETTTSSVTASIIHGGRTDHSRFKISLIIDDGAFCNFTKHSDAVKLLRASFLIIWDEARTTKKQAIEALDNRFDIMDQPEHSHVQFHYEHAQVSFGRWMAPTWAKMLRAANPPRLRSLSYCGKGGPMWVGGSMGIVDGTHKGDHGIMFFCCSVYAFT